MTVEVSLSPNKQLDLIFSKHDHKYTDKVRKSG